MLTSVTKNAAFTIAFIMVLANLTAADGKETLRHRNIDIYWTDTPPVLDGKKDEACWQAAQVAQEFVLYCDEERSPTNLTEVRLCYDAENLYLFWILHEKNMAKLKYGPPEDIRDTLDFHGDVAEIFLAPKQNQEYYQFCASPLGARYDTFIRDSFFNPEWQVISGIFENRWTLEIAIPFASLARDGEFYGTPALNDLWKGQFCRDQGYLHEWSTWRTKESRNFNTPEHFGTLRFAGRKNADSPFRIKLLSGEIFFGAKRNFTFSSSGNIEGLKAIAKLTINGQSAPALNISRDAEHFTAEFPILQGGHWEFSIDVFQGDQKIYHGFSLRSLPPVIKIFHSIVKSAEAGKQLLDGRYPGGQLIWTKINNLQNLCADAVEQLATPDRLTEDQWQKLLHLYGQVENGWREACFDLNLVNLYFKMKEPRMSFALGQVGAQSKIYSYSLYEGTVNSPMTISLAGGETRSRQLVLIPFGNDLKDVEVKFSSLRSENGVEISSNHCRWFSVEYVSINQRPLVNELFFHLKQPDILLENKRFTAAAGKLWPIWIDCYLPAGTPAGVYQGKISVKANAGEVTIPLEMISFGFDLPQKPTLKNEFWFYPSFHWEKFYGGFGEFNYSPELHRKHAEILSRYRVNPFLFGQATYWAPQNMKIFREKSGSFTFDLSQTELFLDNGIEFGGNFFTASLGCNTSNALGEFFRNHQVFDRAGNTMTRLFDCYPEMRDFQRAFSEKRFVDALNKNQLYLDFMKEYLQLLKKKNLLAISSWEYFDEPNDNLRWNQMLETHHFFRSKFPEMRLSFYGSTPERSQAGKKSIGYLDEWSPALRELANPDVANTIYARRQKFAESFLFYTCGCSKDKEGRFTPYMYYHHSYLGPRMHAWMAYKYGTDGFMAFMLNSIPPENMPKKGTNQKKWPESDWHAGIRQGCGTLIYPGKDYDLIPSIRLASFRDGLQDFEYFVILRNLLRYIDKEKCSDQYAEIERELAVEKEIIESVYIWTQQEDLLEAKRARLAELILGAAKLIKQP